MLAISKRKRYWTSQKLVAFYEFIKVSVAYSEYNRVSKMNIFPKLLVISKYVWLSFFNLILFLLYVGWDRYWLIIYITVVYFSTLPNLVDYGIFGSGDHTFLICHVTLSDHMIEIYITLWVGAPHSKSPMCQVWFLEVFWKCRYKAFNWSREHMIKGAHDLVKGRPLTLVNTVPILMLIRLLEVDISRFNFVILHHVTTFETYSSSESGDLTFLFCQVTPRDHMIKGICDFVSRSPSTYVITLPVLVVSGLVKVEIRRFEFFM